MDEIHMHELYMVRYKIQLCYFTYIDIGISNVSLHVQSARTAREVLVREHCSDVKFQIIKHDIFIIIQRKLCVFNSTLKLHVPKQDKNSHIKF